MDNLTVSRSNSPLNKDVTLLTVKGSLDTNTISEFDKNFQGALLDGRFKLVVDLKGAHYVSSAGWGLFVSEIKRIRRENGDLVLAGMAPDVLDVFELLQFGTILKFFPDVDSAVAKGFQGLAPWRGETGLPKSRAKKAVPAPVVLEPAPVAALESAPALAPELILRPVPMPSWRRALGHWHFWAVVLLLALGVYLMVGKLVWQGNFVAVPHWIDGE